MEEIKHLQPQETEGILKLPNSWIERGIKRGMKQGMKQGMKKSSKRIASNMIKKGYTEESIASLTELSVEEIRNIKQELD